MSDLLKHIKEKQIPNKIKYFFFSRSSSPTRILQVYNITCILLYLVIDVGEYKRNPRGDSEWTR